MVEKKHHSNLSLSSPRRACVCFHSSHFHFRMFSSSAVTLLASAAVVLGHGVVTNVVVGGTPYIGTKVCTSTSPAVTRRLTFDCRRTGTRPRTKSRLSEEFRSTLDLSTTRTLSTACALTNTCRDVFAHKRSQGHCLLVFRIRRPPGYRSH